ncbi:MAG: hypothetical protein KatS3mg042_0603 [Rhodothermaceae bacterium]|nr:MAG: hypothetical protein KatS3mg042_0603 [Rhodothermaceae bacterium]
MKPLRYARTLRHLKPWQVGGRLVAAAKRRAGLTRVPDPPAGLTNRLALRAPFHGHDPWNHREALLAGRFCFLNETAHLGTPVDWRAAGRSLLWQFNLHYFHYLHLLRPEEQVALCRSWIASNPVGEGAGWYPYPTALRIVNWCRAGFTEPDLLASLYRQAAFLFRNLETYVYGNHLLENARALVLAGRLFEGQGEASRWLEQGLALYRQETPEQILPDGGHFERSPMYHALMLEGYLDVLNVLPDAHPDRPWLVETANRMGDALRTMTHPDGGVALFNDATLEIAPPPGQILNTLHALTGHTARRWEVLPDTGYFTYHDDELYLILDGGPTGPDYLMAHAHADVFSFELSLHGHRVVVDSGVYEYPAGPMRDYVRSTAAHNTVTVDGQDQIECWGSFRVARRAAPVVEHIEAGGKTMRFAGRFEGYARLLGDGLVHRREVEVDAAQRVVTVRDRVDGRGRHRVESRLHFHPEVAVEAGEAVVFERNEAVGKIDVNRGHIRWEEGWYCPRFGVRERNPVMVLAADAGWPAVIAYQIHY